MARNTSRPLSPHLFDGFKIHYRWGAHLFVSILNRAMGAVLATVGALAFVIWLVTLASGPEAYGVFMSWATWWPSYIVWIGLSFAFFLHFCAGLRHFVMDVGAGFELKTNRMWAWLTMFAAILLTGAVWLFVFAKGVM
jgi:succinate dehydrogenase / fumarate reductase, cytochrome b subunit